MVAAVTVLAVSVVAGGSLLLRAMRPGFGGGVVPPPATATPPSSPSPVPSTTPRASPTPELPVPVTGSLTCTVSSPGVESSAAEVTQQRGLAMTCRSALSDPRLAGEMVLHLDIDRQPDGRADMWGTVKMTDAAGSWAGAWRGAVDAGSTTRRLFGVQVGAGAYEGLRVRYTQVSDADEGPYRFTGTIERVDAVPPSGVTAVIGATCALTDGGTETMVGDIAQDRDIVLSCSGAASDPRLAGTRLVTLNENRRPDGSADMWGTFTIEGDDGAWTGDWTGTIDPGYTTHRLSGTLVGSGAHAGLVCPYTLIGTPTTLYVITGIIGPGP